MEAMENERVIVHVSTGDLWVTPSPHPAISPNLYP